MQRQAARNESSSFSSDSAVSSSSGSTFNPSAILNTELREFLAVPRRIPRMQREKIAEVLLYDLFSGKSYEIRDEKRFIENFGVFYPLFLGMRESGVWEDIKILAGKNRLAGLLVLRTLLEEVFTLIGGYGEIGPDIEKKLQKELGKALKNLKELIEETLASWDSRSQEQHESQEPSGGLETPGGKRQERENIRAGPSDSSAGPSFQPVFPPSEKLSSMTWNFMADEKAWQALDSIIEERIAAKLEELLSAMESHLDLLEVLSLLFPGKAWDYALEALHTEYFSNLEKYAGLLKKSSGLREILDQVGRIELESGSKKLALSPHSKSEVHEVTFSGEIQTMLPVEAVKLKNPILKRKFYADMLEGKLLTYQLRGENWNSGQAGNKRRGPVVALVDTSFSMRGHPETLAKAVVLAVARRMLKEGRDVKVILFSSKWQAAEIELTDRKRMGEEFLGFLKYTFGGGTDFNTALRAGLKTLKEEKAFWGADLLFLTDGFSKLSERPLVREWNEVKAERKARIFSLIIGNDDAGGLEQVSDRTYLIRDAGGWGIEESPAGLIKAIGRPVYR